MSGSRRRSRLDSSPSRNSRLISSRRWNGNGLPRVWRDEMSPEQIVTILVLVAVVGALILDKLRADVVALSGAAVLLMTGAVRPVEVEAAFASPAILALASL